ncbi:MAG: HlyC/CorC family transporter [Oscillospiraceae bacterium]|nr:HlyC/CorC family transporter [Oscillospiraceae bacterium]
MDSYRSTILILVILMALSATFSASETALTAANRVRLKNQSEDGDKKAQGAMKLIEKFDNTLSALLISNNVVNILSSSLTTVLFTTLLGESGVGVATAVCTVVVVVFGEVLPKSFAKNNSEKLIKTMQKPLHTIVFVLTPAIKVLEFLQNILNRNADGEEAPSVTERELISIIDEIEDEGVLEEDEAELVQSAIEFNDIAADEVLTPRVDICAIDIEDGKEEILDKFLKFNYSRMPVYENSVDKIIGFINQKDFFAALIQGIEFPVESLVKPCLYIPPKKKIIDVMHQLQKEKVHMAVVMDEYGGTLGIITLEDILEQLVGDIWDEHDEEIQTVFKIDDITYEVLGEISMDELYEQLLDTKKNNIPDYYTLSGYLMDKMEKIPEEGDSCDDEFLHYTVQKVEDNRIKNVKVRIHQPEDFEI